MKRILPALLILVLMQGCMCYYKVKTVQPVAEKSLSRYDNSNKYFILHQGDTAFHLSEKVMNHEEISGNLEVLPSNRLKYKTTKPHGPNRYLIRDSNNQTYVLDEVHLYLQDPRTSALKSGDSLNIAYTGISKTEVYKKATGWTMVSWLTGPVLVIAGGFYILIGVSLSHYHYI